MESTYLRLWYRVDGSWFHETYRTDDAQWRSAFLILKSSTPNVRIQYVDKDSVPRIEKSMADFVDAQKQAN